MAVDHAGRIPAAAEAPPKVSFLNNPKVRSLLIQTILIARAL